MNKIVIVKVLAFVCHVCPLCIIARALPESKFAGVMKKFGRICPFCIAYAKIKKGI